VRLKAKREIKIENQMDNKEMHTLRLRVVPELVESLASLEAIGQAAAILRGGGTVALPTETVYGLGANALDSEAVAAIFAAKERPGWDPLIVHVCDEAMLGTVAAEIPETARRLIAAFWPGPLTLLLPRSAAVPDAVTAGRALVGVRMPAHPVALAVIRAAGVPVAAPSANRFGHTSPTTAGHVLEDLDGRIDAVVDAGPTACGVESTVLDPNASPMIVYRPGAVTLEQIRAVAGPAEFFVETGALKGAPREAMPSPGVGLRHYAPKARLILVDAVESVDDFVAGSVQIAECHEGQRFGIMLPTGMPGGEYLKPLDAILDPPGIAVPTFDWGNWLEPEQLAQRLFAGLRHLDSLGCTMIFCPVPQGDGISAAIRDRLRKAASLPDECP
jgi:L-threonylcarbamoyladenylate synthase